MTEIWKDIPEYENIYQISNLDCNHKNGIKDDNRLCNLEYCTKSENMQHSFKLGLSNPLNVATKIKQYDLYGNLINIFDSIMLASKNTGIGHKVISNCANGRQYTAGKFIWIKY